MNRQQLVSGIKYTCGGGLDTDITKIPAYLQAYPNAIVEFNKAIIDATKITVFSYKINTAFCRTLGLRAGRPWKKPSTTFHRPISRSRMQNEVI